MPGSMPPLELVTDLASIQRNFDLLFKNWPSTPPPASPTGVGSVAAGGASGYIDYGPFQTTVVTPGAANDGAVTFTHNLGLTATQQTNATVFGNAVDGTFGAFMGTPRISAQTTNDITFKLGNPSANGAAAFAFRFWIRTTP